MFGFGRDLRRLFAQARDGSDRTWIELIGADLLEAEARGQATDAHRTGCREPVVTGLKASTLWREHARRTGRRASLARALSAASDADRAATTPDQHAEAAMESALCLMLQYEQRGGTDLLDQIDLILDGHEPGRSAPLAARLAVAHARLEALKARRNGEAAAMLDASALMDSALHDVSRRPDLAAEAAEVQLDRASLALEAGLLRGDTRLLDQAGRDLRAVVASASPEYRPVTRARALSLCAAGLSALAAMAGDDAARTKAHELFDAAADTFTPDHSPLDWAAMELARAARDPNPDLNRLIEIEAVTAGEGLILGALARERRVAVEAQQAEGDRNAAQLARMETRLRRRLTTGEPGDNPLDWAVDQINLAQVQLTRMRLTGRGEAGHLGLVLVEAAETARELGAGLIADRADQLLAAVRQTFPSSPA
ncbi:hypothetical protein IWC96_12290 [Brevundimonas sp. BAL450]|uniref:hypothetical protein n=1 Tax=Brevundimonas sp. BAL450 TaxID=1708162 RepID=UPI0018C9CDA2|nr:hypothetical protein [Brevundimonas sp. BAL450]MBG7616049.1 hypothetical protein [Brevundimonas sp. BAL450]